MDAAVLVRRGNAVFLVEPSRKVRALGPIAPTTAGAAAAIAAGFPDGLPAPVARALAKAGGLAVTTDDPALAAAAERNGRPLPRATTADARSAREAVPGGPTTELRDLGVALARASLGAALATPEAELIALAREEARLERALGRERSATDEVTLGGGRSTERYLDAADRFRGAFEHHLGELRAELGALAAELVPNLSALLGPTLAARLVASAGGVASLARVPSARLQLLGTRRRPSPERGPRYGHLYRAPRLLEVPLGRRGAYARSVAALASIAARVDATTRRPVADDLIARRDRRIEALKRSR